MMNQNNKIKIPLPQGITQNGRPYLSGGFANGISKEDTIKFWKDELEKCKDINYWLRVQWDMQAQEQNKRLKAEQ